MMHKSEDQILKEALNQIDETMIQTPDLSFFNDLVRVKKRKIELKQKKQFHIFIIIAVFVVTLFMVILHKDTQVFMISQIIITIVPIIGLGIHRILYLIRGQINE